MLESRPIVQKSLAGAGAFMFVFAAAMAGTGVMISGGIGLPHHDAAAGAVSTIAPDSWDFAETDVSAPPVQRVSYTPPQMEGASSVVTPTSATPAPDQVHIVSATATTPEGTTAAGSSDDATADDDAEYLSANSSDDSSFTPPPAH